MDFLFFKNEKIIIVFSIFGCFHLGGQSANELQGGNIYLLK